MPRSRALGRSTPAGIAALLLSGDSVQRRAAALLIHEVAATGAPLDLFLGGMRLGMTRDDLRRPYGSACLREAPRATSTAEREALDAALAAIAAMPQDGATTGSAGPGRSLTAGGR